jgi:hypothetical protein
VRLAASLAIVALVLAPCAPLDGETGLQGDPRHSNLDRLPAGLFVPGDVWLGFSEHSAGIAARPVSVTRPPASLHGRLGQPLPPPAWSRFLVPSRGPPLSLET